MRRSELDFLLWAICDDPMQIQQMVMLTSVCICCSGLKDIVIFLTGVWIATCETCVKQREASIVRVTWYRFYGHCSLQWWEKVNCNCKSTLGSWHCISAPIRVIMFEMVVVWMFMLGLIFVYFLLLQRYSARYTQIPLAWVQSRFFLQNFPIPLDIWRYDIDRCVWYGKTRESFQQGWRMFQATAASLKRTWCHTVIQFKWI